MKIFFFNLFSVDSFHLKLALEGTDSSDNESIVYFHGEETKFDQRSDSFLMKFSSSLL